MDQFRTRPLVPGPTAYASARRLTVLAVVIGLIGLPGFLAGLYAAASTHDLVARIAAIAVAAVAGMLVSLTYPVANAAYTRRVRAELTNGYTTVPSRYQRVDEVEPTSGAVIREAGAPLLDEDEQRALAARARAWATQSHEPQHEDEHEHHGLQRAA